MTSFNFFSYFSEIDENLPDDVLKTEHKDTLEATILHKKMESSQKKLSPFLRLFIDKIKMKIKKEAEYSEHYTIYVKCFDKDNVFKWEYKESFAWGDLWQ